jgi:hypothetical protein
MVINNGYSNMFWGLEWLMICSECCAFGVSASHCSSQVVVKNLVIKRERK